MRAYQKNQTIQTSLERRGIKANLDQCETLRRASMTLHRWCEQECGDVNDYTSWAIERDESTGRPYMAYYPHSGKPYRRPIPDRERGALNRVSRVCKEIGAHFYYQTDPRGCAIYVSDKPINDRDYTSGVGID